MKRLTIVAEALIADKLIDDVLRLGASGYTTTAVEGKGSRGVRASEWEGRNVKIETLVSAPVSEKILDHISDCYLKNYAVIVYVHDVDVIRGEKFGAIPPSE